MKIDLDAKRREREAARTEAGALPTIIEVGGESFLVPAEWPWDALEALSEGRVADAVRALLGMEQWDRLRSHGLTVEDMTVIMDGLNASQGFTPGE